MNNTEQPMPIACPFCGGQLLRIKRSSRWGWFVSCSCHAVGPSCDGPEDAVIAWNTRKGPAQGRFDV